MRFASPPYRVARARPLTPRWRGAAQQAVLANTIKNPPNRGGMLAVRVSLYRGVNVDWVLAPTNVCPTTVSVSTTGFEPAKQSQLTL
jgi:hypothetical protein